MENNSNAVKVPKKISYETLWKAIIRPPRDEYIEEELGSPKFIIEQRHYIRKDFELLNFQGYLMKVSMIEPDPRERPMDIMPCVIYLHANASSRIEGLHVRRFLLKRNINLCVFDFQGSGLSEGEYISLGYNEKHQVKNIVDFVEKYPGVGNIGLWGRSMGAATALIYSSMDKRIKAIAVDSPFEDFRKLAKEMVLNQIKLPGFLIEGAISIIGKSVKNRNGMDINDIKAIDAVTKCERPVVFIHAKDDELVPYHHSEDLIKNYKGNNKILKSVIGGHNGRRPNNLMEYVGDFFAQYLESGYKVEKGHKMKDFIHQMHQIKKDNSDSDEDNKEEEDEEEDDEDKKNIFELKNLDNNIVNIDNKVDKENKENKDDKEKKEDETKINENIEINEIIENDIKNNEIKDNEKDDKEKKLE